MERNSETVGDGEGRFMYELMRGKLEGREVFKQLTEKGFSVRGSDGNLNYESFI